MLVYISYYNSQERCEN